MQKVGQSSWIADASERSRSQIGWPNTMANTEARANQSSRSQLQEQNQSIKRRSRHKNASRRHSNSSWSLSGSRSIAATATALESFNRLFLEPRMLPSAASLRATKSSNNMQPILPSYQIPLLISCLMVLATAASESDLTGLDVLDQLLDSSFAPTRRPANAEQLAGLQNATGAGKLSRRSQPGAAEDGDALVRSASDRQAFARTNELDVFLDDMNHSELRTVASGGPISDLFQPKPMPPTSNLAPTSAKQAPNDAKPQLRGLVASHSEQQIYSECALILQRTYVKNIDDPKHQLVPFGKTEQACISYKQIDKAVEQAKHKLKFREFARLRKKPPASGSGSPALAPLDIIHSSLEPPEDLVAAIGEINMATTQILADQFDLSNDELLNGLPLIDMSKTNFWPLCPLLVRQDIGCKLTRFRTFTGHCNNLKHPSWGAAMTPYARYLPPMHPDGIWVARKSIVSEVTFELGEGHRETHASMPRPVLSGEAAAHQPQQVHFARLEAGAGAPAEPLAAAGSVQFAQRLRAEPRHEQATHERPHAAARSVAQELPSARLVSAVVHRDADRPSHDLSLAFVAWGQVINHDMTRAAQPPAAIRCCGARANASAASHKLCLPIEVGAADPLYGRHGVRCLEFRRSLAGVRPNCALGPRAHQNSISQLVDASFVYGSSRAQADALRLFRGGRLRDRDWFHREGLKPLLPAQEQQPDLECIARPRDLFCFLAGDVRANEQTQLTVLHTLYMREHNRLADRLAELNPHWDDERTFHEARHLVAACVQHVLLHEYIPLLVGPRLAQLYNLTAASGARPWRGHDPGVTSSVSSAFAAAAFRQGHSFVPGTVERRDRRHELVASERLRHLFKRPFLLYEAGVLDELLAGMLGQAAQSHDPFLSEEVSGHLFQPPELAFGHDLAAINIQRGRDQGLPGYNLWREWCGLPRAHSFEQLEPYLTNHTAYQYSRLYRHVDDIDLWSGGVSERRLPGAAIGPTFACIIARQFANSRRADRFWYENPDLPSSFTPEQLAEIRKVSLAQILCANSDDLATVQRWAMRLAHPVLNPRLDCRQLPALDLQFWQEE